MKRPMNYWPTVVSTAAVLILCCLAHAEAQNRRGASMRETKETTVGPVLGKSDYPDPPLAPVWVWIGKTGASKSKALSAVFGSR